MKLSTRAGRSVASAVVLAVGLSGGALVATGAPAVAQETGQVSAKQAKKTKVKLKEPTSGAYLSDGKLRIYASDIVKLKLPIPGGYETGWVSGTVTGRIGGKKVTGDLYSQSKANGTINPKKAYVSFDIKKKHRGKPLKLTAYSATVANYPLPDVAIGGKLKSNTARIKPYAGFSVFHFPKRKTLRIHGYTPLYSKKKHKKLSKRAQKKYEKGKLFFSTAKYPKLRGVTVVVQRAKNKKATKWKTIGRARLNGKGAASFSKGVKKKGQYRIKFSGNARHYKTESWSAAYSGKPTKAGWPKSGAKYVGPPQSGGGRVAQGADALESQRLAEAARR